MDRLLPLLALCACASTPGRGAAALDLRGELPNGFFRYGLPTPGGGETTVYANRPDLAAGPPRPTLVFVTGSGCVSAFRKRADGTLSGGMAGLFARHGPPGLAVVVVEKRGVAGFTPEGPAPPPTEEYLRHSTRLADLRDHQAGAIAAITRLRSVAGHRVVLAGHSEGADVAAAAAVRLGPAHVSRLVFLGSGGATQMYDVLLIARRHFADLDPARREDRLAGLRDEFRSILARPEGDEDWQGHPVRRWAGFFPHAPLDDLLALDGVPVFVGHGSEDRSVPVEAADLIAVEFLRRGRTGLTYRVYAGADHSFTGFEERLLRDVFAWMALPPG